MTLCIAPFSSLSFWALLLLFVIIHNTFFWSKSRQLPRNAFMIATSCMIIWLAESDQMPWMICALSIVASLVYFTGKTLLTWETGRTKSSVSVCVVLFVVALLCYFKYSLIQSNIDGFLQKILRVPFELERHIFFAGISYFSFKFIHFLVECYNKKIDRLSWVIFINYTLFFPSFFSGPINRFKSFTESFDDDCIHDPDYITGLKRIINGLFKKVVLANNLAPYTVSSMDLTAHSTSSLEAIIGVYAYMFYIYFDFAGYTDMAIGSARLVGIHLPENFNYPFLKRNLQQFWANWHMSLTTWLTDYIYWPIAKKSRHISKIRQMPVTTSNIAIIVTFIVCGLWHGDGINFFLWGLYHGFGLAILKIYGHVLIRRFPVPVKLFLLKSRMSYVMSTFITFQYVAFGFMLFALDVDREIQFFNLVMN